MINYDLLKEMLLKKTGISYYNSSKDELICRCPVCEKDSNKSHGHLYIKIPDNPNDLPVYNCFKSDECKGTIIKLLRILGELPSDYISQDLLKHSSMSKSYTYYKKNFRGNKYIVPKIIEDSYISKKQYLKGRIGFDCSIDNIPGLVLNIRKFIMDNNIDIGKKSRFLEFYENNYVGFVTNMGTILILRNIDHSSFKHDKILLKNDNGFFKDTYSIKTNTPKKSLNTIVLCEGIFDLLVSINSPNLQNLKNESCLWAAVLGCGFKNAIPSVLDQCRITAAHFVILSDIDKKDKYYNCFNENPSVLSTCIYRNKCGKDFGKLPIEISKNNFSPDELFWRRKKQ